MAVQTAFSQEKGSPDQYNEVLLQRAYKILAPIGITDSTKFFRIQNIVVAQYKALGKVHDSANAKIKVLKAANEADKDLTAQKIKTIDSLRMLDLAVLHQAFIKALSAELAPAQVIQVKNGMTYNVLPITMKAYEEMLPGLSAVQKEQILAYLTEAREFAMDAESSEKKHAWFGKYKGRINNYLSAAGIDMKKAGQEWDERRKNQQLNKTQQ